MWHSLSAPTSHSKPPAPRSQDILYSYIPKIGSLIFGASSKTSTINIASLSFEGDAQARKQRVDLLMRGDTTKTNTASNGFGIDMDYINQAPRMVHANVDRSSGISMSESVRRLVEETDEAFRSIGSTWDDPKQASMERTNTRNVVEGAENSTRENTRAGGDAVHKSVLSGVGSPSSKHLLPNKPSQPRGMKAIRMLGRDNKPKRMASSKRKPKLTLKKVTINVAGALSGRVFKIEADEMLDRKLPQPSTKPVESRTSIDSIESTNTAGKTPTDPFHLEDLSSRITAAQNSRMLPKEQTLEASTIHNSKERHLADGSTLTRPTETPTEGATSQSPLDDIGIVFETFRFPRPRAKPRKRRSLLLRNRLALSGDKLLKPIQEVLTPLTSPVMFPGVNRSDLPHLSMSQPVKFITLPSTPFTLTSPLFKHGRIRIDQPEIEYPMFSPQDEFMDWTAFQMAILGTMGAESGDPRDDYWLGEAHEQEIEGIIEWWESYGFEGFGTIERADVSNSDNDHRPQDLKNIMYNPQEMWNLSHGPTSTKQEHQESLGGSQSPSTNDGEEKGRENQRLSYTESLPPSPMVDIFTPCRNDEEDRIPMGYNLGHDLDDFLRWETSHVQTLINH